MTMRAQPEQGQDSNLPNYLRRTALTNIIGKIATKYAQFITRKAEVKGRENIPQEEPFILVSNHFGGYAEARLQLATFGDRHVHHSAERHANFEKGGFMGKTWALMMKVIQALPIDASVRPADREQFLKQDRRTSKSSLKHREAVLRNQPPRNDEFFRLATALLQRGEPIIMYPEGLFLHEHVIGGTKLVEASAADPEKPAMKQGYRGLEMIVRKYHKKSGEPIKVLPVASLDAEFTESGRPEMIILPPVTVEEYETAKKSGETSAKNFTDFVMTKIAAELPEKHRGYYAKMVEQEEQIKQQTNPKEL